jgi:hypothetical protein
MPLKQWQTGNGGASTLVVGAALGGLLNCRAQRRAKSAQLKRKTEMNANGTMMTFDEAETEQLEKEGPHATT